MQPIAQQRLMNETPETKLKAKGEAGTSSDANEKDITLLQAMFGKSSNQDKKNDMLLVTSVGTALVAIREGGEALSCRESMYLLMNEPASSSAAYWLGYLLQLCLIVSALCTTAETHHLVNEATGPEIWIMAKILFNIIFSVETFFRIMCHIPFKTVHKNTYVLLDVITVLPLYLRLFLYPDSMKAQNYLSKAGAGITIRIFEAFGAFRILKLCRYYEGASLLAMAVGKSLKQLYVPMFMLLLMVFCFAAIVYEIEFDPDVQACVELWKKEGVSASFIKANSDGVTWDCSTCTQGAECQHDDAACAADFDMKCLTCNGYPPGHPECGSIVWGQTFVDIPRSMWFMLVTVSTVGYGDVSPTSWQGQIFVCWVIICGLIFLAMPLAIVGSTFGQVWDARQIIKLQRHMTQLLARSGIQPTDAVSAFKKIDTSGDGNVTKDEFTTFLQMYGIEMDKEEVKELWGALDTDKSGSLTMEEFMERAFPGTDLSTLDGVKPANLDEKLEKIEQKKDKAGTEMQRVEKQQQEVLGILAEQKERTALLENKLSKIESMLSDMAANQHTYPGRKANGNVRLERSATSSKLVGGGRSGTKGRPPSGTKSFGSSTRVAERDPARSESKPERVLGVVEAKRAKSKSLLNGALGGGREKVPSPAMSISDASDISPARTSSKSPERTGSGKLLVA